jgi:transcription elongation factor GreB
MSKAFVRESDVDDDDEVAVPEIPAGSKNYITPAGHRRLKDELLQLLDVERPEVVRTVSWAASNGDRSENGDYIYGKKRLREIDRRIRYLDGAGREQEITIVGIDEVDPARGRVSWISPIARAMTKAREGDVVPLRTPAGVETLEILDVRYLAG